MEADDASGVLKFDWPNLPSNVRRAFARSVAGRSRIDDKTALEVLTKQVPMPDAAFIADQRGVVLNDWFDADPAAIDRAWDRLANRVPKVRRRLALTRKKRADAIAGLKWTTGVHRELLVTFLESGRLIPGRLDLAALSAIRDLGGHIAIATSPNAAGVMSAGNELWPFQAKVLKALNSEVRASEQLHGLVVMPTGSGKTRTAVTWLSEGPLRSGRKVLWVTHRKELLEQTALTFLGCAHLLYPARETLRVRLFGGGYGPSRATTVAAADHDVVIATVNSLSNNLPAVRKFLRRNEVVVVFDEAHHSVASTWERILLIARDETDDWVIGLTATPTRMGDDERRRLAALYGGNVICRVELPKLIGLGYLAKPLIERVETLAEPESDMTAAEAKWLQRHTELPATMGRRLAENVGRNELIVGRYLEGPVNRRAPGWGPTIVFAIDDVHARLLAERFQQAGIRADWISYRRPERAEVLERFRSGQLDVLVNIQILTEGVDLPEVQTVLLARPTKSEVLLSQMIGRAMRGPKIEGGTEIAYLVSFHDHWERFPNWLDPIALFPELDEPVLPAAGGVRDPLGGSLGSAQPISFEIIRQAAAEAVGRFPASFGERYSLVPVGWYSFVIELPATATEMGTEAQPGGEVDVEARRVTILVSEHDRAGFQRMHDHVAAGGRLSADGAKLLNRFFATTQKPKPSIDYLASIAEYVRVHKTMPRFERLDVRDEIDPRKVAERLLETKLPLDEQTAVIDEAYQRAPTLVNAVWGGQAAFAEDVLTLVSYHLAHGRWPVVVERGAPYLRGADLADYQYGNGIQQLKPILDDLLRDRRLFPRGLEPPAGIEWYEDPNEPGWAYYDQDTHKISVSRMLDSDQVPPGVLRYLVYHELLHHEDTLTTGREHAPHDRYFYDRQAEADETVDAEVWLDSFSQRFVVHDDDGPES